MHPPRSIQPLMISLCIAGGMLALVMWHYASDPAEIVPKHSRVSAVAARYSADGPRGSSSDAHPAAGPSLVGTLGQILYGPGSDDSEVLAIAPTATPAANAKVDQAALQMAVAEFEAGKENAFFSPREAARKLLAPGARGDSVRGLRDIMRDTAALKALPQGIRYLTQQPPVVTARMAALDLFFAMVDEDDELIAELAALIAEPFEVGLEDHVARVVMAEKYESLAKLGSLDFSVALKTYLALADPQVQAILRPALVEGLASTGISYTEAEAVVNGATLPA